MTSYNYSITDTTNLATKITALTTRINIDPEIAPSNLPVISVVYVEPDVVVTFTSPLTERETYIVTAMVNFIFYGIISGIDINYNNIIERSRNISQTAVDPTAQYDLYSGYNIGSIIFIISETSLWVCLDPTPEAAVWVKLPGLGAGPTLSPDPMLSPRSAASKIFSSIGVVEDGDYLGQGSTSKSFPLAAVISGMDGYLTSISLSTKTFTQTSEITARIWHQPDSGVASPTMMSAFILDGSTTMSASSIGFHIPISKLDTLSVRITCANAGQLLNGVSVAVDIDV